MERHGQEQRLDSCSWADQGRHDLAELVELIAAAREFASEVKESTVAFVKDIKERVGYLFGKEPQEKQAKAASEQVAGQAQAQEQARPPTPEMQARLDDLVAGFQQRMEAQLSVQHQAADFGNHPCAGHRVGYDRYVLFLHPRGRQATRPSHCHAAGNPVRGSRGCSRAALTVAE